MAQLRGQSKEPWLPVHDEEPMFWSLPGTRGIVAFCKIATCGYCIAAANGRRFKVVSGEDESVTSTEEYREGDGSPGDVLLLCEEGAGFLIEGTGDVDRLVDRQEAFSRYIGRLSKALERAIQETGAKKTWLLPAFFLAAALAFLPGNARAQERPAAGEPGLRCMVNGYDVVLINDGTADIAAGTLIGWSVPRVRVGGEIVLGRPLPARGSHFLTAVMGSNYTNPRTECVVTIRGPADET